jgi:predicted acyltransferase
MMGKASYTQRIPSIDCFRGFTIMLMIAVNYLAGINIVPAFLKHAQDILSQNTGLNMTITDLVAPTFIFVIGVTYRLSFTKRVEKDGLTDTYYAFATRFLAITGMGAFFTGASALVEPKEAIGAWGVLQAIGAAGLIALIFVRLGTKTRFTVGLVMIAGWQFLLDNSLLTEVLKSAQGGVTAILSWGGLMLIATAMGDIFIKAKGYKFIYAVTAAALLGSGLILSLFFVASKHRVSVSYVLISLGISSLGLFLFHAFLTLTKLKLEPFQWWGRNPLLLYLIHMALLGITYIPGNEPWYANAPWWAAVLEDAAFIGAMFLIAWGLNKKKIYFKI